MVTYFGLAILFEKSTIQNSSRRHVYCESVVNEGSQTVVGGLGVVGVCCLVDAVFVVYIAFSCIYTDD